MGTALRGRHVVLRPLVDGDADALLRIRATAGVARWWPPPEDGWPTAAEPDTVRLAVLVDDAVAGLVQYGEETDPDYRHASIDVFLDPAVHGRGLGLDTVLTLAVHLVRDRGHHRLTIDPAATNAAAVGCYTAAGFRPVGVMRAYERDAGADTFHDGLLMDALAADVLAAAARHGHPTAPASSS